MASLFIKITTLFVVISLSNSNPIQPEHEDTISKPAAQEAQIQRTKRQWDSSFPTWQSNPVIRIPAIQRYSYWQPQYIQIKRPYIIPIWGASGRIPVYLPPQPLYLNPGFPPVNPPKKFPGVAYLPPTNTEPPGTNDTTTKETDSKFGDAPVWDQVNPSNTRPTRRPPQGAVTHPPLVHKETSSIPATGEKSAPSAIGGLRPGSGSSSRPQTTPAAPAKELPVLTNQPSRCVWAIISCCSADSKYISYSCFEQLGCTGAFWDTSPCESEFARAAISTAMNYYNSK